ncbi:MAG: FHA domain-containing protein, partial [Thermodesulfovibrionales bacterium]
MAKALLQFQGTIIKEYQLDKDIITIGRKPDNDIKIDNLAVSGYHAKITHNKDGYFIEDTNSLNGTYVNGVKVLKQKLYHGDTILIGKHSIVIELPEFADIKPKPSRSYSMEETIVIAPDVQQRFLQQKSA